MATALKVAGIGHNSPPMVSLKDQLAADYRTIRTRVDELLDAADVLPAAIADEDVASKVTDYVKQCKKAVREADDARKNEKEPHLRHGQEVDSFFKALTDELNTVVKRSERMLSAYTAAKIAAERKRAAEEAERLRKEAGAAIAAEPGYEVTPAAEAAIVAANQAAKVANGSAAQLGRVRGVGAQATVGKVWDYEITDFDAVDLNALRKWMPMDQIQKSIAAAVKAGLRELAGVRVFETVKATVR